MPNIKLKEDNHKGKGAYADVYLHEIEKNKITVKVFNEQNSSFGNEEGKTLEKVKQAVKDCPGIL